MIVFLSDIISIIPMAALVAVMIMVSISTFDWSSVKKLKTLPLSTNIVMLSTVAVTVYTHNLALGVITGVLFASLFFANKISHFMYCNISYNEEKTSKTYEFVGQVFFNSADKFYETINFKEVIDKMLLSMLVELIFGIYQLFMP
jgi:SulP family sulfate permease